MGFVGGVGYTNIDLIYAGLDRLPEKGEEIYAKHFEMHLGGGIPATLINAGRLGIPSKIITFIGKDFFSDYAYRELRKYDAEVVNIYRENGMPVVLSSTMVFDHDRSFLSYHDEADITDEIQDEIYHHLTGASVIDMNVGFLDVYKKLKQEGTILIFDTGWEDDLSIEKYRDYLEISDYYLPNQKEALKITGTSTVEEAADKLGEFFDDVIIKLDKDGCMLKNKNGITIVPSMKGVEAVDSTGAGDAFMSGFMYGIYHKYPIEQCIRFGNVTGGTCVKSMGCLTSYVNEEELHRLSR